MTPDFSTSALRARNFTAVAVALGVALATMGVQAQPRGAPDSFADLAEKLTPAVVNISTTQKSQASQRRPGQPGQPGQPPDNAPQFPPGSPFEEFFKDFFDRQQRDGNRPQQQQRPATSLGSGFVVDPRGYIVTNNHVIADADEVKVIFHDDLELPAKIIGRDPKTDLAVLKVEPTHPLVAVPWGDSDKTRVGDWVMAIGNPFGLGGTVTAGIVSARGRNIRSGPYDDFIQTDASINKGNSGGPLFNTKGEVIGVNTAIFSQTGGSVGIGFSVPAALAKPVVAQLTEFGRTRRGWLGVRIQTVTDEIAESLGLDKPKGALVAGVTDGGPAEKAKIEAGDIVISFDGKPIASMNHLPRAVAETKIGREVPVDVWRKGKLLRLKVTVGELDESDQVASVEPEKGPTTGRASPNEKKFDVLGLTLAPITPELRQRFDIKEDIKGVVIVEVANDGPAGKKDVRPGDVILEVAQNEVKTPDEVINRVKEVNDSKRKSVLLLVQRAGDLRFIAVPIKG
jgi:serine protease Do